MDVLEDMLDNKIHPLYLSIDFDAYGQEKERVHEVYKKLKEVGYQKIYRINNDISLININKLK